MYIHGRIPILEAIRAGKNIAKIFFRYGVHGESLREIRVLARKHRIPMVELPKQKFDRLGDTENAQGIVALVEDVETLELSDLLTFHKEQDAAFFIALDSITDPHNVGAIIRTAECAGVHGVILPVRESSPLTETVIKASAGAVSHQRIAKVGNLHHALEEMKSHNIWIAGLDEDGDTDLFQLDGTMPLCLVIGSEGKGMRPLIRKSCDMLVRIPLWGRIESLNASVAAALAMYEVRRKRIG